jgi:hypothetical protein
MFVTYAWFKSFLLQEQILVQIPFQEELFDLHALGDVCLRLES